MSREQRVAETDALTPYCEVTSELFFLKVR